MRRVGLVLLLWLSSATALLTADATALMEWLNLEGPGKAAFADPPPAGTFEVSHAVTSRSCRGKCAGR